jgi:hypothetical protein
MATCTLEHNKDEDDNHERVMVSILDFDWLFENGNALTFIKLLNKQEDTTIFA